ncbi:hypothetical protein CUTER_01870 [Corynebacterium uterequi]|uniref:TraX protein n=1 Tax=Corynebacterium uterequi TaxID=1072256 RepID=A0A0G3HCG6_9CORY|nr:hypothetical protein CUTER_01870 [Corynebacterium uterequi]
MEHAAKRRSGVGVRALLALIVAGAAAHIASSALVPAYDARSLAAPTAVVTVAVVVEALSWVAYAPLAFLLAEWLRREPALGSGFIWAMLIAVAAEVPYDLLNAGEFSDFTSQNPVWAVVVILIVVAGVRRLQVAGALPEPVRIIAVVAFIVAAVGWLGIFSVGVRLGVFPAGIALFGFALIFRYLRGRENTMMLSAGGMGAALLVTPALGVVPLHFRDDAALRTQPLPPAWVGLAYPVVLALATLVA